MTDLNQTINITGSITLSDHVSSLIICQHNSPIVITLSPPLVDGIVYQINRADGNINNTVTLFSNSALIRTNSNTSSNSIILNVRTYTEIVSLNGNWELLKLVKINPRESYGIYSMTLIGNNNSPYLTLTGNSVIDIANLPFDINIYQTPSIFRICVTHISGVASGNFIIYDDTNLVRSTNSVTISSGVNVFSSQIILFPSTSTSLRVAWSGTSGANDKLGANFIFIS